MRWKALPAPPIIGALGHSNDCILKQAMKHNSHKHLFTFVQAFVSCWKRNSGLRPHQTFWGPSRSFGDPTRPFGNLTRQFGDPTRPSANVFSWPPAMAVANKLKLPTIVGGCPNGDPTYEPPWGSTLNKWNCLLSWGGCPNEWAPLG